ncbi:MAG: VTT domain-containing protein [Lutispora sp.]|nr:VTT domain-containing protein [Lutispora sp.]
MLKRIIALKNKKVIIFIIIIFFILLLNHHYGWSDYLGNTHNLDFLKEMVQNNLLQAALIYMIITVISCVVLALPGITFAVFAGILFGPWFGIIFCLFATTIGASIAFLVGRFFLKDAIKPLIEKNKYLKKLLFDESGKSDMILLMITRLVPLFPYNLQNFAYGITDIGFWKYTNYTFLFMLPGVTFITIGAAGITAQSNKWVYFTISGVLFVAVFLFGYILQRKYLGSAPK